MESETKQFDTVGFVMDFEGGEMTQERMVEGFQALVDSGLAWQLQGCYGRQAAQLIRAGLVVDTHGVLSE